jgi:hypothetical protein
VSVKTQQFMMLGTWTVFVVAYAWIFHIEPPHDEEYGKWLFLSLLDTGLPWAFCSIPLGFLALSLDTPPRTRRRWIKAIWASVVVCLAWLDFRHMLHPSPLPDPVWYKPVWHVTDALNDFAFPHLFSALFILAASLWIEKKLVRRGLLT